MPLYQELSFSLTSSSIELVSFMMDPVYLYCLTCSIYELLIFKFSVLMSFLAHYRYFVFFSLIVSPTSNELFFSCWNVSISDCLVRTLQNLSFLIMNLYFLLSSFKMKITTNTQIIKHMAHLY